jgi:adenylate cyclase
MWNAPAGQADHADLACRAALRMLESLPDVAADWVDVISTELHVGIGVHTGRVVVGNAGSRRQTKYGPRGQAVHLASRVEAAAKELGVPLLATRSTVERLSNRLAAHRICRVRMRGVRQPVDLFRIYPEAADAALTAAWRAYDTALEAFEKGQLSEASEMLRTIDQSTSTVPTRLLADEVQRAIRRKHCRRSTDQPGRHDGMIIVGRK